MNGESECRHVRGGYAARGAIRQGQLEGKTFESAVTLESLLRVVTENFARHCTHVIYARSGAEVILKHHGVKLETKACRVPACTGRAA